MQNIKIMFILFFAAVFCFSCGVSSSSSASAPSTAHSPSPDDPTQNYFGFTTDDASNSASNGSHYKGTAILYKIYTSSSSPTSDYSSVEGAADAKTRLDALGYKFLNGASFVIPASSSNQSVEIRLFDETSYTKGIKINGSVTGIPTRHASGNFQFSSTYYPSSSEGDFSGSATTTGPWYVAAYALPAIQEDSLVYTYPSFKYLGVVKIYYNN